MGRSHCSSERPAWSRWLAAVLLVLLATGGSIAVEAESPDSIAIVIGSGSAIRGVSVDELREVYLRRQRLWKNGLPAMPVNLPADSPVRVAFSRRVLGRRPEDLESYWRRLYFEGVRPPLVLRTSQAVCAYVAVEASAIGYVRMHEVDAASCRVLFVLPEGSE